MLVFAKCNRLWSWRELRTIDEGVENVFPVLLDQIVDVSENSAGLKLARFSCNIEFQGLGICSFECLLGCLFGSEQYRRGGVQGEGTDLPHGERIIRIVVWTVKQ